MLAPYVPYVFKRSGCTGLLALGLLACILGGSAYGGVSSFRIFSTAAIFVPMSLIAAGLAAAVILLPPLRAIARINKVTHVVTTLIVAGAVLAAAVGLWAWNYAGFTFSTAADAERCEGEGCSELFSELTLRHAVPPLMRNACLGRLAKYCAYADGAFANADFPAPANGGWPEYVLLWGLSLIPALFAGVLTWRIAKPLPPAEALPSLASRRPPEAWRP